jgi:beta-N-acetylhexosaminidase
MATDSELRRLALRTLLAAFAGTVPPDWASRLLSEGLAGYTLFGFNIAEPVQLSSLTATLRAARPDVLIAVDEEGGDVTRLAHATGSPYPGNAALGAVDDVELTRSMYAAIGTDLAAAGITLDLAPTVDVNSTDDNPIIGTRSFGSDPLLVARHAAAAVTGLQSAGVAACAKHFPGHGATVADSHVELPTVDAPTDLLRARDLPPFAAAVAAGARSIMTAHIRVPELTGDDPATFSRAALVDLLRGEYAFRGAVITDALEMKGAAESAGGIGPAAVRALAAGADLLCLGAELDEELVEAADRRPAGRRRGADHPAGRLDHGAARAHPAGPGVGLCGRTPGGTGGGLPGRPRRAAGGAAGVRPLDRRGPGALGPWTAPGRHRAGDRGGRRGVRGRAGRAGGRAADRGGRPAPAPHCGLTGADRTARRRSSRGGGGDGLAVRLAPAPRAGVRHHVRRQPRQRTGGRGGPRADRPLAGPRNLTRPRRTRSAPVSGFIAAASAVRRWTRAADYGDVCADRWR